MAKIISFEGKYFPKIEGYVIYPLGNDLIIRAHDGFTSKKLNSLSQYEVCKQNASEFGRVSSLCKHFRMAIKPYLPLKNNLLIVNSFTKKMRAVMVCDAIAPRGNRTLANALTTNEGCLLLKNHAFNPVLNWFLDVTFRDGSVHIQTDGIVFPDGSNCVSFRLIDMVFDFETAAYSLREHNLCFYDCSSLANEVVLAVADSISAKGTSFTMLEVVFYTRLSDALVRCDDDSGNQLFVLEVK